MRKFTIITVLLFTFTAACSSAKDSALTATNTAAASKNTGGGGGGERMMSNSSVAQVSLDQAEQTQAAPVVTDRKIIRNAELQLEANAPEEAQAKIGKIAEAKGGFVVETQSSASDARAATRDTVTMTVRVPSAKFDEALSEIRATANRIIEEIVRGEDVTEEFIDIEARLKTQKALEAQFLEIMKRSNSVADALNVQTEIARVRGDIEKIEGRKRFLESQASLSTIKIRLQTPAAFSANTAGFFGKLGQAFGSGFDAALSFILFFVTILTALLPFFLLIVLPLYFVIRYFLRKSRRGKSADEIAREEINTKR
jgi:Domain of unknown function (DUF4349)